MYAAHRVVDEFQEVALAVLDEIVSVSVRAVTQSLPDAEACVLGLQSRHKIFCAESLADRRADRRRTQFEHPLHHASHVVTVHHLHNNGRRFVKLFVSFNFFIFFHSKSIKRHQKSKINIQ